MIKEEKNIIKKENFQIAKKIIKGRIKPFIYAFRTEKTPKLKKAVKIGDTHRSVDLRLEEWNKIYQDIILLKEKGINPIYEKEATLEKYKDVYFRDYSVHKYLENKGFRRVDEKKEKINDGLYISNEFFNNVKKQDIEKAVKDINEKYKSEKIYDYYDINSKETKNFVFDDIILKKPRKEQKIIIDDFKKRYEKLSKKDFPKKYLMYAVMRFGKTFTALSCANEVGAKIVLVVSAKADVGIEWKQNVEEAINFKEYKFINKENLLDFKKVIIDKNYNEDDGKKDKVVVFLTLQDLKDIKLKKHSFLYENMIDITIVDEAHYGARANKYGKILKNAKCPDAEKLEKEDLNNLKNFDNEFQLEKNNDCEDELYEKGDENFLKDCNIQTKVILHLSGTPYRILYDKVFPKEDVLCKISYSDILDYKENWNQRFLKYSKITDIKNKEDLEEILAIKGYNSIEEFNNDLKNNAGNYNAINQINKINDFDNPYFGFPIMLRFAFNPSEKAYDKIEELKNQGGTISLSLLFKPEAKKGKRGYNKFHYEEQVLDILQSLDGKKEDKNIFPLLKFINKKNEKKEIARHIVMVLPYCASCDAMEKLLEKNKNMFNYINEYKVINISGLNINKKYKDIVNIKNEIEECEKNNIKTLTLTVERMLTGSTVKEWDTMIFFRDSKSAEQYDQAIYRLQNQFVETIVSTENTKRFIKIDKKPQTILIDFSLSRVFELTEKKAYIYNLTNNIKDGELDIKLKDTLRKSPIYAIKDQKMVEVSANDIMQYVAKYSGNKGILDEAKEIEFNIDALSNPEIRKVIETQEAYKNGRTGLSIIKYDESNQQDIEVIKGNKINKNIDNEGNNNSKIINDYELLMQKWKIYWAKVLFFAFLSKTEFKCMNDIINYEKDKNHIKENNRILVNLGFVDEKGKASVKLLNLFLQILSDTEIANISRHILNKSLLSKEGYESDDNYKTELDKKIHRVEVAMDKFSRLGQSEIITPTKVCEKMLARFSNTQLKEILHNKGKIIDINSKIAEFTVAFIKRYKNIGISIEDNESLQKMFYSIPSAGYTYEFTRYVYEKLGLDVKNISTHFVSYDLIKNKNFYKNEKDYIDINNQIRNLKNQIKNINKLIKLEENEEKTNRQKEKYDELSELIEGNDYEGIKEGLEEELEILSIKKTQNIDFKKISKVLCQGDKNFSEIMLEDKAKKVKKMKFDIVVGNPPYQETVKEATEGNNKNAIDIYQNFQNIASELSKVTCLLYPAKEIQRGIKNTLDNSLVYLRIFNGSNKKGEKHIFGEDSIFGDVVRRIPGDVGIFMYNKEKTTKKIIYQEEKINRTKLILPVMKEFLDIAGALSADANSFKFSEIKKVCESNFVSHNPNFILKREVNRKNKAPKGYTKVLTNHIAGSGGEARWFYIKTNTLDRSLVKKYKIVISSAYPNESFLNSKNLEILSKDEAFGRTKMAIYDNDSKEKVLCCKKYLSTNFAKVISLMTPYKFLYYLPDFDLIYKVIDWTKSIENIDEQLCEKYKIKNKMKKIIKMFKLV